MGPFSSRVILLTFLYFIQGLPYGLQARFLPVYLRTKGHSLTSLGFIKMLLAPWLCKALWAPLVDKYSTKQKWLQGSIVGLTIVCALTSVLPPDNTVCLCVSIFLLNLFAATQDIAVDSIAINLLTGDELGQGNTAQVVGYKLGAIFGGGILVLFMDFLGWTGLFLALTMLYVEALLFVHLSPTMRRYNRFQLRQKSFLNESNKEGVQLDLDNFEAQEDECKTKSKSVPELNNPAAESSDANSKSSDKSDNLIDESTQDLHSPTERDTNLENEHASDETTQSQLSGAEPYIVEANPKRAQVLQNSKVGGHEINCTEKESSHGDNAAAQEKTLEMQMPVALEPEVVSPKEEISKESLPPVEDDVESDANHISCSTETSLHRPEITKCESSRVIELDEENIRDGENGKLKTTVEKEPCSISSTEEKRCEQKPNKEILKSPPSIDDSENLNTKDIDGLERQKNINTEKVGQSTESGEKCSDKDSEYGVGDTSYGIKKRRLKPTSTTQQEECKESMSDTNSQDSFTCSSVKVSGRFAFLWDLINVPDTRWLTVYVLIYKLGEQGALGMLPLFFVDSRVKASDVTFWTGVVGQGTSILGSCLGGWILSHPKYKLPCKLLIYQLSLFRLLPLGMLLWVVLLWTTPVLSPVILYRVAILALNMLLLVSGMVTTATFTLMMECTKQAPPSIQATHYTLLSSLEVFGKLIFMSVCGALVDLFGYTTMYLVFVILAAALLPWLWRYPDILCQKVKVN